MNNSIMTIRPYRISGGVWVFDDEALGIHREPFVGDINKMIDGMIVRAGLPGGKQFTAMFSANPFPWGADGPEMAPGRVRRKLVWRHLARARQSN